MSLLWSGKNNKKQLTNQTKPSPTSQIKFQNSAQDLKLSQDGSICCQSIKTGFIEGISPLTSFWPMNLFRGKACFGKRGWKQSLLFRKVSAGMTVEASILLPIFLFFFLNLGCAIEMIRLHGNLQLALWQIGSRLSVYGYVLDSGEMPEAEEQDGGWWEDLAGIVFASTYVKAQLVEVLGEDYLEHSPLAKGVESLQLWESEIFGTEDEIEIVVTYSVSPWNHLIGFSPFRMANKFYSHIWNGYQLPGAGAEEVETVFLAENGEVYHLDRNCTYLCLSVSAITAAELTGKRNQSGRRYRPCEKCTGGGMPMVIYITEEGDCYHYHRECSGLTRKVRSASKEEAAGYRPCSRCGQKSSQDR